MFSGLGKKNVNILISLQKELKLELIRFGGYKSTQNAFPRCSWQTIQAEFLN